MFDLVYPFKFAPGKISVNYLENASNVQLLNEYFLTQKIAYTEPEPLVQDKAEIKMIGEKYLVDEFDKWTPENKSLPNLLKEFADAFNSAAAVRGPARDLRDKARGLTGAGTDLDARQWLDYYLGGIDHTSFGSIDDAVAHWTAGGFLHFEFWNRT